MVRRRAHDVVDDLDVVGIGPVLADVDRLAVARRQIVDVGLHVVVGLMPALVVGQADDVEVRPVLDHVVQEVAAERVLAAQGEVDLQLGVRKHFVDGPLAGLVEAHASDPVRLCGIVHHLAFRPDHAVADLVAHLHDLGSRAGRLEGLQGLLGILVELVLQRLAGQAFPLGGLVLLVRVGPGVAVVEIQRELHARRLDALGEGDGALRAAEAVTGIAARSLRVDEQAQADHVEAMVRHDPERVLLGPVHIVELGAARLHRRDFGHVRSDAEIGRLLRGGSPCGEQPQHDSQQREDSFSHLITDYGWS